MRLARVVPAVVLVATLSTMTAHAQSPKPGETTVAAALSGVTQFDTDIDNGGQFRWWGAIASGTLATQINSALAIGLRVQYDYQRWNFDAPAAFGGTAPWGTLDMPSIGVSATYSPTSDLRFTIAPAVEWTYESGASAGDALAYGAVLSATKVFSSDLVLGIGAGVFRQIDETKVFPFVILNWKINDRLRVANPFPAGPTGGAGLELVYAPDDNWEVAAGGTYRSYRFRLKDDGPTPGGIGENRFVPLFARVSRKLAPQTTIDLYALVSVGGRLSVVDANGNDRYRSDYSAAPGLGLSLVHRF
jgi:hypothetical protein